MLKMKIKILYWIPWGWLYNTQNVDNRKMSILTMNFMLYQYCKLSNYKYCRNQKCHTRLMSNHPKAAHEWFIQHTFNNRPESVNQLRACGFMWNNETQCNKLVNELTVLQKYLEISFAYELFNLLHSNETIRGWDLV